MFNSHTQSLLWAKDHPNAHSRLFDKCWKLEHSEPPSAEDPGDLSDDAALSYETRTLERPALHPSQQDVEPVFHLDVDEMEQDLTLGQHLTLDANRAQAVRFMRRLASSPAHFDTEFPVQYITSPTGDHHLPCPWPIGKFGNPFQPGWNWEHFDPYRLLRGRPGYVDPLSNLFKELAQEASSLDFAHRSNTQRHVVSAALRLQYPLRQTVREPDVLELCRTNPSRLSAGVRRRFGAEPAKNTVYSEFHLLDLTHWILLHRSAPSTKDRILHKTWLATLSNFLTCWLPAQSDSTSEPAVEPFLAGPEPFDGPLSDNNDPTMLAIWRHLLRCGFRTFDLQHAVCELAQRALEAEHVSLTLRAKAKELGMSQADARVYTAEHAKWFPILDPRDSRIRIKLSHLQVQKLISKQTEYGQENFLDAWVVL